ncbi:MAG: Flp pilus assembly protein CpaB [Candidatus Omnitrophica bacterium]|nr:Flp pilus assembly protein CpaB [Candidatus Omnitrophota bacterium]
MQKQWIILIIGVVLALAAVFMTTIYIDQQRKADQARMQQKWEKMQASQTAVLVAKKDMPKGTPVDESMFETEIVISKYVQPQAVTSMDRIAGMVTIAPVSKGEQITLTKLSNVRTAGVLSEVTPVGKRAITISIDNISALAGMIKAGDYVDVIAMIPVPFTTAEGKQAVQPMTTPLFQNVLVLAVGQETSATPKVASRYKTEEKKEVSSPLITLALGPQEASLIAFVQEQGKIRLTLRSPADSKIEQLQPANWDTLFQYLAPKISGKSEAEEQPKAVGYVDVYRGLNKEKVPLYK